MDLILEKSGNIRPDRYYVNDYFIANVKCVRDILLGTSWTKYREKCNNNIKVASNFIDKNKTELHTEINYTVNTDLTSKLNNILDIIKGTYFIFDNILYSYEEIQKELELEIKLYGVEQLFIWKTEFNTFTVRYMSIGIYDIIDKYRSIRNDRKLKPVIKIHPLQELLMLHGYIE